jgi:ABC-type lipoprotein release transport system permease subunit
MRFPAIDLLSVTIAAATLIMIAVAAILLAARRATHIDPAQALRCE